MASDAGKPIGVAFVGGAHPHIVPRVQVLAALPDVGLVGCYDPDAGLATRIAERCGLRAFASAPELLDHPGVDLAIIEGWDADNPRYAREAVSRGKAILLEKPGAPDLAAMRALIADVRDRPIPFQVGYMLAFSPAIAHARRILADGVLGPISLARFHAPGPVGAAREPCLSRPGDLGGVVYGDGAHVVDLMIQLLGVPRSVKATLLRLPEGQPVLAQDFIKDALVQETTEMPYGGAVHEDAGAAVFDYGDKLAVFDMTAWGAHPWVEAWTIEIYGTDGTLQVGLQPPWYRLFARRGRSGYQAGLALLARRRSEWLRELAGRRFRLPRRAGPHAGPGPRLGHAKRALACPGGGSDCGPRRALPLRPRRRRRGDRGDQRPSISPRAPRLQPRQDRCVRPLGTGITLKASRGA